MASVQAEASSQALIREYRVPAACGECGVLVPWNQTSRRFARTDSRFNGNIWLYRIRDLISA
jgi:hypothetical protein